MLKLETQLEQFRKLQKRFDVVKDLSLGIDQGTGALRYCLVNRKSGEIVKWGSYEIAAQTASAHSEKEQKKQGSLSSYLKELSKDIPKNRLHSVFVNLRDPSLIIGNIEKDSEDNLKEEEFIQSFLRKELPFALEDACYFCRKLDMDTSLVVFVLIILLSVKLFIIFHHLLITIHSYLLCHLNKRQLLQWQLYTKTRHFHSGRFRLE